MRTIISILTVLILNSCQSEIKAKFEIRNKTAHKIDSIKIMPNGHNVETYYLTLEPGESKIYWLEMTELPKVDGDYILTYKDIERNIKRERFGYFTNGYPLEEVTNIDIQKDTIIIDQVFKK